MLEESIFKTIKDLLGPDASYDVFDPDILIFINAAISVLTQLGIGPKEGFRVEDDGQTWADFLGDETINLEMVKSYIYMKVKMAFDPPASSFVMSAYQEACKEYEWRLNVAVDNQAIDNGL